FAAIGVDHRLPLVKFSGFPEGWRNRQHLIGVGHLAQLGKRNQGHVAGGIRLGWPNLHRCPGLLHPDTDEWLIQGAQMGIGTVETEADGVERLLGGLRQGGVSWATTGKENYEKSELEGAESNFHAGQPLHRNKPSG